MSNEVMTEGFFGNKNIPACEKLGAVAILGFGPCGENAFSYDGKAQSFVSLVPNRGGNGHTTVMFTYGRPDSLNEMAVKTYLYNIGLNHKLDIDKVFDGSMSDKEVVSAVSEFFRETINIDKSKVTESYEKMIAPKLARYMEKLRNTDNYLTQNPKIGERVKAVCDEVYGADKKKQMME